MLHELFQPTELFVTNVTGPYTWKIAQLVAIVSEDDALVSSMQQKLLQC